MCSIEWNYAGGITDPTKRLSQTGQTRFLATGLGLRTITFNSPKRSQVFACLLGSDSRLYLDLHEDKQEQECATAAESSHCHGGANTLIEGYDRFVCAVIEAAECCSYAVHTHKEGKLACLGPHACLCTHRSVFIFAINLQYFLLLALSNRESSPLSSSGRVPKLPLTPQCSREALFNVLNG